MNLTKAATQHQRSYSVENKWEKNDGDRAGNEITKIGLRVQRKRRSEDDKEKEIKEKKVKTN